MAGSGAKFVFARAAMQNRWISLGILLAITAFFAVGLKDVELKTIFSDLLPRTHPFVQTYKEHPNFGNPLTVTVMVKKSEGDIYNPDTLQLVWDLTRDVDLTPAVDHDQILSITTEKARYAQATPFGIESQPIMGDAPPKDEAGIVEFKERVLKSPNSKRFLISTDETATLITATFIERILDYGVVFEHMQKLKADYEQKYPGHEIYFAGQPMLTGWVYFYQVQMWGIFAVTALALLGSLFLYMGNIAGVVAPVAASLVAAIWGFGFVGWLGDPIEPLIMVVPLLLVARSFSHCVQFIERYYEILHHVGDRKRAAEISLSVMVAPGTLGIVTDATGLFLIGVAPIPVMERFAIFCGFWAAMLVPANVFFVPLLLTWLPTPRNVEKIIGAGEGGPGMIKRLLSVIAHLTFGRMAPITTAAVLAAGAIAFVVRLDIAVGNPVEGSNLLWEDSEYNVAVSQINRNFPGLNTLEIVFEQKDDSPSSTQRVVREAETVINMSRIQYLLENAPNPPVATLSYADYLPEAQRLFAGGNVKWAPIDPNDAAVQAATGALLMGSSPKAYSHVADYEQRNGTVSAWYKDNKQETVDVALKTAREVLVLTGVDFENFRIRLGSGTIALQQSINDTVQQYQYAILFLLNVVILLTCSFAYRSVAAGVLLLVPVNLSNMLLEATMVEMGIGLDVNTLPIAAIGIGVGIDYGIYLLSRICEEYQEYEEEGAAILAATTTTGKAIFFTATIVLIGIFPWYLLSGLKFLADMGLLLVMVMLINMVIALIVVPLLVWLFKPPFVRRKDLLVGEGFDISEFVFHDDAVVADAEATEGKHASPRDPSKGRRG